MTTDFSYNKFDIKKIFKSNMIRIYICIFIEIIDKSITNCWLIFKKNFFLFVILIINQELIYVDIVRIKIREDSFDNSYYNLHTDY